MLAAPIGDAAANRRMGFLTIVGGVILTPPPGPYALKSWVLRRLGDLHIAAWRWGHPGWASPLALNRPIQNDTMPYPRFSCLHETRFIAFIFLTPPLGPWRFVGDMPTARWGVNRPMLAGISHLGIP